MRLDRAQEHRPLVEASSPISSRNVTRAITGHVTEELSEHYSHFDRAEKLRAADQVVALAGLRATAPADHVTLMHPHVGDQAGDSN